MDSEAEKDWMDEALRKRLTELLPKLEDQASLVSAALSRNQGLRSLLLLHRDTAKKEIKDYCHQLQKLVADCQKCLIDEVAFRTQEKEELLVKEREKIGVMKERIIHCRERAGVLLKIGQEEVLKQRGKEVVRDIVSLLKTSMNEAPIDIKHLSFQPLLSLANFQDAESLGYIKSTAIEHPDVNVTSLCQEAFVGLTEYLTLQVAQKPVPEGANVIEVQITDAKGANVEWGVEDNVDGTYSIVYTPESVGLHLLTIKIYKTHIKGSPFRVNVREKCDTEVPIEEKSEKANRPRISEGAINAVNRLLVRRSLSKRNRTKIDLKGLHDSELDGLIAKTDICSTGTCDVLRSEAAALDKVTQVEHPSHKATLKDQFCSDGHNPKGHNPVHEVAEKFHSLSFEERASMDKVQAVPHNDASISGEAGDGNSRWGRPGGWLEKAKKTGTGNRSDLMEQIGVKPVTDTNNNQSWTTPGQPTKDGGVNRSDARNWRTRSDAEEQNMNQNLNQNVNRDPKQNSNQNQGIADGAMSSTDSWKSQTSGRTSEVQTTTSEDSSRTLMDTSRSELSIDVSNKVMKSEPVSPLSVDSTRTFSTDSVKLRALSPGSKSPRLLSQYKVKSEPILEVCSEIDISSLPEREINNTSSTIKGRGRRTSLAQERLTVAPGGKPEQPGGDVSTYAQAPAAPTSIAQAHSTRTSATPASPENAGRSPLKQIQPIVIQPLSMSLKVQPENETVKRSEEPIAAKKVLEMSTNNNANNVTTSRPPVPLMPATVNYSEITVVFLGTLTAKTLEFPIGVNANKDMVAVGNSGGPQCVLLFGSDGKLLNQIGGSETFKRPSALVLHEDRIFIKDDVNVHVFDTHGNFRFSFANGRFERPYGLALTPAGTFLILEESQSCIYEFYSNGALADRWGFPPLTNFTGNPRREKPKCRFMGVHGQLLVVTDLGCNAVYFVDLKTKTWLNTISHPKPHMKMAPHPTHFNEPSGVTFDRAGNVLIADARNNRIQVYTRDGTFIRILPLPKGKLHRPADIHLTADGKLYVANLLGHNVAMFKLNL